MTTTFNNTEILQTSYPKPKAKPPKATPLNLRLARLGMQTFGRLFPNAAGDKIFELFQKPRIRARHKRSDALLEQAEVFEILYGDRLLKGYQWGNGERTVLMVHGWESRGTALRSFVPPLLEQGFRVVAMDGPAHGDSDGKSTNLSDFAGAVIAMIRHIGQVEAMITHSFGGATSSYALGELATDIQVNKMVYIGTPDSVEVPFNGVTKSLHVPPAAAARFRQHLCKVVKRDISQFAVSKFRETLPFERVLVVHDRFDEAVPFVNGQKIAENWDKATLLVTEGYGHFVVMKNPDVIQRVADFIVGK